MRPRSLVACRQMRTSRRSGRRHWMEDKTPPYSCTRIRYRFVSFTPHTPLQCTRSSGSSRSHLCRSTKLPCAWFSCFDMTSWYLSLCNSFTQLSIPCIYLQASYFSISSCSAVLPTLFSSDPMTLLSAALSTSFDALDSISRQRLAKSCTCSSSLPSPSSIRA